MAAAAGDLDGQSLADALVANHVALLDAECQELVLAARWGGPAPGRGAGTAAGAAGNGAAAPVRGLANLGKVPAPQTPLEHALAALLDQRRTM